MFRPSPTTSATHTAQKGLRPSPAITASRAHKFPYTCVAFSRITDSPFHQYHTHNMSHPLPAKLEGKLPQPLPLSNMVGKSGHVGGGWSWERRLTSTVRANYCHIDNLSGLLRSHWERFEWFDASRQTWVPSARAYSQYGLCACDLKKGFDPTDREAPARWVFRELESCGQIVSTRAPHMTRLLNQIRKLFFWATSALKPWLPFSSTTWRTVGVPWPW